jgi:putative membrane protein insertion efficiency factor
MPDHARETEDVMRLSAKILRLPIVAYRRVISPFLPPSCRYLPTCSAYALEAIETHGALRGGLLATRRLCRCHPWGGHGFDPVPPVSGGALIKKADLSNS